MYALPHQLEVQTDDWLNEAARFVTETASRKELGAFSVSERWANPPPHLELGESAAWTLTFRALHHFPQIPHGPHDGVDGGE